MYEVSEAADLGSGPAELGHQPMDDEEDDDGDFDYGFHDSNSFQESDLLDAAEAAALTDAYHTGASLDFNLLYLAESDSQDMMTCTPKKRKQM